MPANSSGAERQPITACSDPVLQYTWQPRSGGAPGREEIASAIEQAESMMERRLGFSPLPKWYVDQDTPLTRPMPAGSYGYPWNVNPYAIQLRANSKYVLYGGREAWSVIQAGAAIVYTDPDGDGYSERATVTVATTVTSPDEIALYYPVAGAVPSAHDSAWEIRPINVSISSGVATITFERHQAVLSTLLESLVAEAVDGLVDANFLSTVDVYRHYNDPSAMGFAEWSPPICDSVVGTVDAQNVAITPIDKVSGILGVQPGNWNTTTSEYDYAYPTWWRTPDRVRLWLRAGYQDASLARPLNTMTPQLERAITYLALTYLDREWLTCEQLRNMQAHWRADLAINRSSPAESASYKLSTRLLDNPFGTTRAAIFAWRVVQPMMVGEAVLA